MSERRRVALGVEYDGRAYSGWQIQPHTDSVQGRLERALSGVADQPVSVICAGRTDAGVHALEQVVHFETTAQRPDHAWVLGCNSNLPADISIRWAKLVPEDFHARFSARWRQYRYVILSHAARSAIHHGRVCWHHYELDLEAMRAGAAALEGRHDFSAFRAAACQAKTPVRTLHELTVTRVGRFVVLDARADGFLHHMVRTIAGTLMTVGRGERAPSWVAEVLASGDRTLAGVTAEAEGLYLMGVGYDERHGLPPPPTGGPALLPEAF